MFSLLGSWALAPGLSCSDHGEPVYFAPAFVESAMIRFNPVQHIYQPLYRRTLLLVFLLLALALVTLAAVAYGQVQRGFERYVTMAELGRMEWLARQIESIYAEEGANWEFLRANPRSAWLRLQRPPTVLQGNEDGVLPDERDSHLPGLQDQDRPPVEAPAGAPAPTAPEKSSGESGHAPNRPAPPPLDDGRRSGDPLPPANAPSGARPQIAPIEGGSGQGQNQFGPATEFGPNPQGRIRWSHAGTGSGGPAEKSREDGAAILQAKPFASGGALPQGGTSRPTNGVGSRPGPGNRPPPPVGASPSGGGGGPHKLMMSAPFGSLFSLVSEAHAAESQPKSTLPGLAPDRPDSGGTEPDASGNILPSEEVLSMGPRLGLLDADGRYLVGNRHAPQAVARRPLSLKGSLIGYLTLEPADVPAPMDQSFMDGVLTQFALWVGCLMLGLSSLAWLGVRWLFLPLRRVAQDSSGMT